MIKECTEGRSTVTIENIVAEKNVCHVVPAVGSALKVRYECRISMKKGCLSPSLTMRIVSNVAYV